MTENQDQQQPQQPNEDAIADYVDGVKKMEMAGYETGIKKARTALYVTAAAVFIGEMLSVSMANAQITPLVILIALIESGIFVGLAIWTKTKPYSAIIVGLVVFILMWIVAISIVGGKAAYSGIILRVIIISYLVSALKPAKAWEDMKKTL
jgi:hypothetical protein